MNTGTVGAAKTVEESVVRIVNGYLNQAARSAPNGEIVVDKIVRDTKIERNEIISALRHSDRGVLIVGRKGMASRFAFGEKAKVFREDHNARVSRSVTPKSRSRKNKVHRAQPQARVLQQDQKFVLALTIAGVRVNLPMELKVNQN